MHDQEKGQPVWRDVAFRVPQLASFDDGSLGEHFPYHDGAWSSQTKAALAQFGVDRLDLDENWASNGPNWICPGCGRRKAQLFRLTSAGVLLARLDIHHDHLSDSLKARLRDEIGSDWIHRVAPGVSHFEKFGSQAFARFAPTLVCQDCNAADGSAKKKHAQIQREFSFRPSEIGRFVTPTANGEHIVDFDAALEIFEAERADFENRRQFLDGLFAIIARGEMVQEKGNLPLNFALDPMGMLGYVHSAFLRSNWDDYQAISKDLDSFVARSVSRAGVASNPTKRRALTTKVPSAEDISSHDGGGAPDLWNTTADDWQCPACGRAKHQIIRVSNNARRKWSGKLLRHTEYILSAGYDVDDDDAFGEWIDHHEIMLICMDCANILPAVRQREPTTSRNGALFQLEDMRAVARAAPHEPHDIDWDTAIRLARESTLHTLTGNYWSHYSAAVNCRKRHTEYLEYYQGNSDRAWRQLTAYYRDSEGIDPAEVEEHVDFLLMEANRIGDEGRYR